MNKLILTGDLNLPDFLMTDSEINHLRRLLGWLRCEYMLDPSSQKGCIDAANTIVSLGIASAEQVEEIIVQRAADTINRCPKYILQAIKMLDKALREHEKNSGVVDVN